MIQREVNKNINDSKKEARFIKKYPSSLNVSISLADHSCDSKFKSMGDLLRLSPICHHHIVKYDQSEEKKKFLKKNKKTFTIPKHKIRCSGKNKLKEKNKKELIQEKFGTDQFISKSFSKTQGSDDQNDSNKICLNPEKKSTYLPDTGVMSTSTTSPTAFHANASLIFKTISNPSISTFVSPKITFSTTNILFTPSSASYIFAQNNIKKNLCTNSNNKEINNNKITLDKKFIENIENSLENQKENNKNYIDEPKKIFKIKNINNEIKMENLNDENNKVNASLPNPLQSLPISCLSLFSSSSQSSSSCVSSIYSFTSYSSYSSSSFSKPSSDSSLFLVSSKKSISSSPCSTSSLSSVISDKISSSQISPYLSSYLAFKSSFSSNHSNSSSYFSYFSSFSPEKSNFLNSFQLKPHDSGFSFKFSPSFSCSSSTSVCSSTGSFTSVKFPISKNCSSPSKPVSSSSSSSISVCSSLKTNQKNNLKNHSTSSSYHKPDSSPPKKNLNKQTNLPNNNQKQEQINDENKEKKSENMKSRNKKLKKRNNLSRVKFQSSFSVSPKIHNLKNKKKKNFKFKNFHSSTSSFSSSSISFFSSSSSSSSTSILSDFSSSSSSNLITTKVLKGTAYSHESYSTIPIEWTSRLERIKLMRLEPSLVLPICFSYTFNNKFPVIINRDFIKTEKNKMMIKSHLNNKKENFPLLTLTSTNFVSFPSRSTSFSSSFPQISSKDPPPLSFHSKLSVPEKIFLQPSLNLLTLKTNRDNKNQTNISVKNENKIKGVNENIIYCTSSPSECHDTQIHQVKTEQKDNNEKDEVTENNETFRYSFSTDSSCDNINCVNVITYEYISYNSNKNKKNKITYRVEPAENKEINFVLVDHPSSDNVIRTAKEENNEKENKKEEKIVLNNLNSQKNENTSNQLNMRKVMERRSEKSRMESKEILWKELEEELKKLDSIVNLEENSKKNENIKNYMNQAIQSTSSNREKCKSLEVTNELKCLKASTLSSVKSYQPKQQYSDLYANLASNSSTHNKLKKNYKTFVDFEKSPTHDPLPHISSFVGVAQRSSSLARVASAKVTQMTGKNDSLERRMRSFKYMDPLGIEEKSVRSSRMAESDAESLSSMFCGGGLEFFRELKKIEMLPSNSLSKLSSRMRKGSSNRSTSSRDNESCSSKISSSSEATIRSEDQSQESLLVETPGLTTESQYAKLKMCSGIGIKKPENKQNIWYKKKISKSEAMESLKGKPIGSFLVRDSSSYEGSYGLVLKVLPDDQDPNSIRNYLIECTSKGLVIRGNPSEPTFPDLESLVRAHILKNLSLPCKLVLPRSGSDISSFNKKKLNFEETFKNEDFSCRVIYLGSLDIEGLRGSQAVGKALEIFFSRLKRLNSFPVTTICHLQVSKQGLTLTDTRRIIFFRRYYSLDSIDFIGTDENNSRWSDPSAKTKNSQIFGLLTRNPSDPHLTSCHLLAEMSIPADDLISIVINLLKDLDF